MTTVDPNSIILRYFDCRSRGQALRFAFVDSGMTFRDERVKIEEIPSFRESAQRGEVGAPFGALPQLEWKGVLIAQTLAIASYLSEKLDLNGEDVPLEERAYREMVTNAAHLDMQSPFSQLLWLRVDCTDEHLRKSARALLEHLGAKGRQLEALLEARMRSGPFFGGERPAMPDYFVYESVSRTRDVFGETFAKDVVNLPRLAELAAAMAARPAIRDFIASGGVPYQVSGNPAERSLRERLPEVLSSRP